ncbi:ferritin-like domain-containing protein [Albibacterium bauzanense]|uniref:Uncharacterized protein (TIGR02284 family) n=1 Tax=Albibacterium bauzanense TaxID=653929 RepID=A0A4R1LVY4_9SPHI|nr:PA2169 family four-helix-bundle protein [Albibacterium bauzanense]TCK83578.1 uncharacterized protein (TIGR02284 family) [Albibacterium bauzanense]
MSTASNTAEVLNDLIQINNDRIEGYQKALEELDSVDADLNNLFNSFITQSQELKSALQSEVSLLGEEVDTGTTVSGKIYRTWMDVKSVFTGKDRQTVLNNCEFGEDAAQKAYKEAEKSDDLLPNARALITSQKLELKSSHDKVKILRDSEKL